MNMVDNSPGFYLFFEPVEAPILQISIPLASDSVFRVKDELVD